MMTSADFRRWRMALGVTQPVAAKMLDLSTRSIASYETGERPIPRTTAFACAWLLLRDDATKHEGTER